MGTRPLIRDLHWVQLRNGDLIQRKAHLMEERNWPIALIMPILLLPWYSNTVPRRFLKPN